MMLIVRLALLVALCSSAALANTCYGNYTLYDWNTNNHLNSHCTAVNFQLPGLTMNSTGEWVTAAVQVLGDSSAGLVIETSAAGSTTASNGLGSICFQVSEGYGPVVSVLPASGYEGDTINFAFYASLEDNCASPPPYEPPAFAVLYVQANQSIAVMGMGRNGLLSLSRSSAVAIPGEDFTFSSGSSIFRLETQLTDQQYLTTAGMCNIGQWCSVPDGSLSYMVNITEVLELPATHWKLQSGGLVTMQAAHGYGLTTTGNDIVMTFDDDDLAISESDLDELEVTPLAFVDFITARDFALWPQANDQAKLAYHVDVGQGADFYTYTECDEDDETYDCDHIFDISFRDFLYYHLEHPTALSSIERLHMAFKAPREAQQRNLEQPAFELLV